MKICVFLIVLVLLTGCSSEKIIDSSSANIELITEENSVVLDEPETETWQTAYRKQLEEIMNDKWYPEQVRRFSLYDLTGDDIPELIVSKGLHREGCEIYTFDKSLIDLGHYGIMSYVVYYPDKNILLANSTVSGIVSLTYYDTNKTDTEGSFYELADLYDNSGMSEKAEFKIDDKAVTKEEYNEAKDKYSDKNEKYLGNDFILNEAFIQSVFNEEPDWNECYKSLLLGLMDVYKDYCFSLYDVTGDNIPELFISDGTNASCTCCIYSFDDGLIFIGRFGAFGTLEYSSSRDLFYCYDIFQGHEFFLYHKLNECNNLQCEMVLYNNVGAAETEDDIKYEINREEVSYDEYKSNLDKYKEINDFISLGRDYKFTESDIVKSLKALSYMEFS